MKKFTHKFTVGEKIVWGSIGILSIGVGSITVWEKTVREPVLAFFTSDTIVVQREVEVKEETRIDFLSQTPRAIEACETAKQEEAKKMRLEEIADEAKELQASLM